ncbi:SDR family oxidoreductase [Actinokineospora auranticolor]|uniref:NADP-dependent 3-hydroxy acid dehydrogenase YdfG n=1 Tax=Actinokineospora auranticolor TaxID=155976 RepID=A0A2S6GP71_9PSEU|nr:SDR family oxidoreductase [Actinokineospora auranticolor]PPK67034.1 NADP-dependent 3-hydroxy acid dehydrogenase YdfG [Actinokineospora auranticolor]
MVEARVGLVTGGGSGIGAATTEQLLARGYRVAITGRNADKLRGFAERLGSPEELLVLPGDAADHVAVQEAVAATVSAFGRLDCVVANAGYATFDDLGDGDPAGWRDMVLTNVLGPAILINAALPALREAKGRIVLLGSVAGHVYTPGNIYGATKWAITGLAENTRRMLLDDKIGVTLVSPGATRTDFFDAMPGGAPDRDYLPAEKLGETVVWALTQPEGVDVNTIIIRPTGMFV